MGAIASQTQSADIGNTLQCLTGAMVGNHLGFFHADHGGRQLDIGGGFGFFQRRRWDLPSELLGWLRHAQLTVGQRLRRLRHVGPAIRIQYGNLRQLGELWNWRRDWSITRQDMITLCLENDAQYTGWAPKQKIADSVAG